MESVAFVGLLSVFLMLRIGMHFAHKKNIEEAVEKQNWRDVRISWTPRLGSHFRTRYLVTYTDNRGIRREQYCDYSLLFGIK